MAETQGQYQNEILQKGNEIFSGMEEDSGSIFNKDWWYGKVMEWSMRNEHFKVQMFRFVDVLPYLNSGSDIARHLKEYFAESGEIPSIFNLGVGVGALVPGVMATAVKKNVTQMAKMFITGESPDEAMKNLEKSRKNNICFTADLLGEACLNEKEALEYQTRYLELIQWLVNASKNWNDNPQIDHNHLGPIPKVNVSVKISSLYSQIKTSAWEISKTALKDRIRPIFQIAKERNVFINLDLEQYALKELTFEVFKELATEPAFINYPHLGIVVQTYLRDSLDDIKMLTEFAKQRKTPFTIRLVKGAYWDFETVDSAQRNWSIPVYTNKPECDANYEDCAVYLMKNYKDIHVALASHNARSLAACFVHAEKLGLPKNAIEVQMLFGMAEPIKKSVTKMGYRVREYAPIGELIPGMAYLVRRLLENTSNESFLRSKFVDGVDTAKLLQDPKAVMHTSSNQHPKEDRFYNEALIDFGLVKNRKSMEQALEKFAREKMGREYLPYIGKKEIKTGRLLDSVNPSQPTQVVGKIHLASPAEASLAIDAAKEAYKSWKTTTPEERASYLEKLADLMVAKKFDLIATQVYEVGKPWAEADGDVAEAIDFLRYYARDMRRLAKPQRVGKVPGEISLYHYQSRGVALVISPWNFPLAILTGQVAAAIVTGNTVVMKPAEQSTVIAAELMELIRQSGIPQGVVNFVPGIGEEVGEFLVNHHDVQTIAFTGSKAVGLHIIKQAGNTHKSQQNVKRCIVEMGGKNAVIIDSDADLDEAVLGVTYSAFGFSGQKCSACSRVIVLESIYDRFTERLADVVRSIQILPAAHPKAYYGPVIDKEAHERILNTIEQAKRKHKLLVQGEAPQDGYFVPPTVFVDVQANDEIAQQEIFGPVVAVIKAKDLDEALEIANGTEYALTGGVFSRSPANIERIKNEFEVGNLYINRGITGAMVDRHPFGGFKMSGIGSKTGGPDYLLQFMEPRCITENTMRRGFAPAEE